MTDRPKPSHFPALFKNEDIEEMNALYLYRWVADTVLLSANAMREEGDYLFEVVEDGVRYERLDSEEGLSETREIFRYVIEVPKEWRIEIHRDHRPKANRWVFIHSIEGDQAGVRRYLEWLRSVFGREE